MRHLLALAALFAGLATIGMPEQARAGAIENALTELAEQAKKGACTQQPRQALPSQRATGDERRKARGPARRSVRVTIPTLQFGADRALE